MGITLYKSTPTLTAECLLCKDTFLQALKYTIPEFAQEFNGEYSFTVDGKGTELESFISGYTCDTGNIIVDSNTECEIQGVKPYIESISKTNIMIGTPIELIIYGSNFDDNIKVSIDNCTVNIINIKPTEIIISVLGDIVSSNEIIVSRCGAKSFGNKLFLNVIDEIVGNGDAGTFTTAFSNKSGNDLWGNEWTLEKFGTINSLDSYFKSSKSGTPSSNTGPKAPISTGNYYMYIESSNPNNGTGQYATASTSNFRKLQSIEFDYHMFGSGIGELLVQGKYSTNDWEVIGFMTGQQNLQNDSFKHVKYLCSGYDEIRFCFNMRTNSTSYTSDIALDNIKIIST